VDLDHEKKTTQPWRIREPEPRTDGDAEAVDWFSLGCKIGVFHIRQLNCQRQQHMGLNPSASLGLDTEAVQQQRAWRGLPYEEGRTTRRDAPNGGRSRVQSGSADPAWEQRHEPGQRKIKPTGPQRNKDKTDKKGAEEE